MRQGDKHNRPLVVILTKFDSWWKLTGNNAPENPWRTARQPNAGAGDGHIGVLDYRLVERQSQLARQLLLKTTPEIVTAAEGFAREVIYVPVSAVGWEVEVDARTGQPAIRPDNAAPYWVTTPFLYGLSRAAPGLIPGTGRS